MTGSPARPPVVVGVGDGPPQHTMLTWAAGEAERTGAPLLLVHVRGIPPGTYEGPAPGAETEGTLRRRGQQVLRAAAGFLENQGSGPEIAVDLAAGDPVRVLSGHTHDAAMMVLGSSLWTRARRLFPILSVALPVVARAHCPVAVVRDTEPASGEPFFVVGVDGSPASRDAVRLAFEEAAARDAALRALYVWHPPALGVLDERAAMREAQDVLGEVVHGHSSEYPRTPVHHEVVRGHPVRVLADASERALGLVVGTRGHGGFPGMLLGSVSQGVVRHSECSVVTVPQRRGST